MLILACRASLIKLPEAVDGVKQKDARVEGNPQRKNVKAGGKKKEKQREENVKMVE